MENYSAQQIYEMTGCLPKCDMYSYKMKPMHDMVAVRETEGRGTLGLQLYIPTAETEVREQVIGKIMHQPNNITQI